MSTRDTQIQIQENKSSRKLQGQVLIQAITRNSKPISKKL